MFVDSRGRPTGKWEDERFRTDAEALSKFVLAAVRKVQEARPPQIFDGVVTVHCIIAGVAFSLAVLICKLPVRERKKLREYLVHKLDGALRELGQ